MAKSIRWRNLKKRRILNRLKNLYYEKILLDEAIKEAEENYKTIMEDK